MTVAVTHALAARRPRGDLRLHRQHLGLGRRLRGPGRADQRRAGPAGQDRRRQAGPGGRLRRPDPADRGQFRRLPRTGPQDRGHHRGDRAGQLGEPGRGSRARRPQRSRSATCSAGPRTCTSCRSATPATSPRTGRVTASTTRTASSTRLPRMFGFQAAGAAPLVLGHPVLHPDTIATAIRIGAPASWDGRDRRPGRVRRADRLGHRRADPGRLPAARLDRGRVRRARVGGVGGRAARHRLPTAGCRPGPSWCAP